MKKYSKVLSVVMASLVIAVAFTGCGSGTKKASSDITTVTVWSGNGGSKEFYEKMVDEYNNGEGKEKGIYIDYQVKGADSISQTVQLALQNGTGPDMFNTGSLDALVENDYIVSVDDLPGGKEYMDRYRDSLVQDLNIFDGKAYSIPQNATTHGLVYNVDMFKAAGIVDENGDAKPPKTIEEFIDCAKKLTNPKKGEYGFVLPMKFGGVFNNYILTFVTPNYGFTTYNPKNGERTYDKLAPFMQMYLDMKKDGSIFPGTETTDNDTARAQFAAGKVGMIIGYSYDYGVLTEQFPATCEWDVTTLPLIDENVKYKQSMYNGQNGFFINKKSLDTVGGEKLLEVYKFFTSDDVQIELYKSGISIPTDFNLIKDVKVDESMKQWKKFAELVEISVPIYSPKTNPSTAKSMQNVFIEDVWTGKITPEEAVEGRNEMMTKLENEYYEQHPNQDRNIFIIEDWDISR